MVFDSLFSVVEIETSSLFHDMRELNWVRTTGAASIGYEPLERPRLLEFHSDSDFLNQTSEEDHHLYPVVSCGGGLLDMNNFIVLFSTFLMVLKRYLEVPYSLSSAA